MIEKIKKLFEGMGEIYTIFKLKDEYAVVLNNSSETIYILTNDGIRLTTFTNPDGNLFASEGKIIYNMDGDID